MAQRYHKVRCFSILTVDTLSIVEVIENINTVSLEFLGSTMKTSACFRLHEDAGMHL